MKKKTLRLMGLTLIVAALFLVVMISCKDSTTDVAEVETTGDAEAGTTVEADEEVVVSEEVAVADIDSCTNCHNDTTLILARQVQWENSLHGSGYTFERNGADCANCHTSEGYTERIAAGTFDISEDVENPSPVNCRTCHSIHDTYTSADWALTYSDPVTLELTGDVYDLGNSNQCATCHQPRISYEIPTEGGGDIEITSTRFGPHHGPQSSMLAGVGGYGEYNGSDVHYDSVDNGCITCHMTDTAYGKQAGGHTMNASYEYHGEVEDNLAGCIACHEDIEDFDRGGVQTDIEELLEEVHTLLVAQGLIDGESGSGITGTFTSEQAGALWNYKTVEEDRSMGVHNPKYAEFLLETALEALQ